jgi:hypothetical protein
LTELFDNSPASLLELARDTYDIEWASADRIRFVGKTYRLKVDVPTADLGSSAVKAQEKGAALLKWIREAVRS